MIKSLYIIIFKKAIKKSVYALKNNKFSVFWQTISMSIKTKLLLVIGGVFVGFVNGFLGTGGGIIVVPLLELVLKESVKESHATAILIILPLCIVSSIAYLLGGVFDYKVFIPSLIGSIIGALIGTIALSKFKSNVIVFIFSILIVFAGVEILVLWLCF